MRFRTFFTAIAIMASSCFTKPLSGEIQQVVLTWLSASCQAGCDTLLDKQLRQIYGVADVEVNRIEGQVVIKWKPDVPFTFTSIDTAFRMVGLNPDTIFLKVRGSIKKKGQNFTIVSEGDQTEFYLMSPITPTANTYVEQNSYYNRELSPTLQDQLLEGMANKQAAVINGPLFDPYRSPPLFIVIERVTFENEK